MSAVEIAVVTVAVLLVVVIVAALASPVVAAVRERLRLDVERRAAELRLQHITSEALLQMLKEHRPS